MFTSNYRYIINSSLIFLFLILVLSSCVTFKLSNIHYDEENDLYGYGIIPEDATPLRNSNNELVSKSNYNEFLEELGTDNIKYKNDKIIENTNSLKSSDFKIAKLYSESVDAISNSNFEVVPGKVDSIFSLYPNAVYFSDCSFLQAYALEKTGNINDAKEKYNKYITFSTGKYTERLRGYRDMDSQDSLWLQQRNYARNYLSSSSTQTESDFFKPISPKYHYNSFMPGYSFNIEDYDEKTKHILMFVFALDISDNFAFGAQYYRQLNKYFDVNPRWVSSNGATEVGLAVPIKLYKSEDNRFAFKLSPILSYTNLKEINFEGFEEAEVGENIIDYGLKISAGYYVAPKLLFGATYTWHRYNKDNPFHMKDYSLDLWYLNEYDASLYYDLFKGFSLKSGIKSGDFVAGIYWSGWEISYAFKEKGIIFRIDMY